MSILKHVADKAHFYSLYSVVTLKIRPRLPKSDQIFKLSRYYNIMKFGQNPSFALRDRVQKSVFWSKFEKFI